MPAEELAKPIVHLLDDDLAVRDSIELLLQIAGIDVRSYASAIDFLNNVDPTEIQCLVIDVHMPGIDGIDLLDRLRIAGIIAPAIFISAIGNTAALLAASARTGARILLKPFRPRELIERIRELLYHH